MFECLILGDSIGVGTAQAINARYLRRCEVQAVERATADQIRSWRRPAKPYGAAIFAIGSNDAPGSALARKLLNIRAGLTSRRVIWLLPYGRRQAYIVASVAATFGDETLDLKRFRSEDRIHPADYGEVARTLLR